MTAVQHDTACTELVGGRLLCRKLLNIKVAFARAKSSFNTQKRRQRATVDRELCDLETHWLVVYFAEYWCLGDA